MNAVEIEEAVSRLAEAPFDPANFPYAFLEAFGNKETTLKRLRSGDSNQSDLTGGVLQRNNIHLKVCAVGEVPVILTALRQSPATTRQKAKFILATDGSDFQAENLVDGDTVACAYSDFHDHFGFFLPLAGITTVRQISENAFDIKATGRLNRLYIELLKDNPDWATAARREDLNHFMARLIFCFFAEDTSIFQRERLFTATIEQMTKGAPEITHEVLSEVFRAMSTKLAERESAKIKTWANGFPYVNGGLFSGNTDTPRFSKIARVYLIKIGELDWKQINPDIFGSMIQAVADDEERGSLGMHYTSVPNILKVLNPLFIDELRARLAEAGDNLRKLLNLRQRLARIRVFDPACGSGNFLVIAYKELRALEAVINDRRGEAGRPSDLPLTNYRGIELRHFSCEIARLALIIAEYQCDVLYRGEKLALLEFLPLEATNWITCHNALRIDWLSVCPPTGKAVKLISDDLFDTPLDQAEIEFTNEGGETFICGNPPYLGSKKKTKNQEDDMVSVGLSKAQLLDYVAAFIIKGVEMVRTTRCRMALVSTSSICQGEQVALLWPRILPSAKIGFAYRPFKWANSASRNAGVWCTIIGLEPEERSEKMLFFEDKVQKCTNIAPYLIQGPSIICAPADEPISSLTRMKMGSNAVDGKRLILGSEKAKSLSDTDPRVLRFIKKYGGTKELVSGVHRFCVWVDDHELPEAMQVPALVEIFNECRKYREGAGRDARKAAGRPHSFCYSTFESDNFVHVGNTIGNSFNFVPCDLRRSGYVSNHNAFTIYGIRLLEFAVITSSLHRIWAETVAGRLGDGTRYGNTTAYNTFPVPPLTDQNKADLTRCAEDILLAREAHFPATIAELYAPETMPANLRAAHERNDETLERIYIGRLFKNDTERLEKLFSLYTEVTTRPPTSVKISGYRKTKATPT